MRQIVMKLLLVMMFLGMSIVLPTSETLNAQTAFSCNDTINELAASIIACSTINNNHACYGNSDVLAIPSEVRFYTPSDEQPIKALQNISTDKTGATLLRLHVVGREDPVTAILYGGVTLNPKGENVFLMRVEGGAPVCESTPSGMLIRTEQTQRGQVTLNGIDIEIESTAFITMEDANITTVVNIEGTVVARINGEPIPIQPGLQARIGQVNGVPTLLEPPSPSPLIASPVLQWLDKDPDGLQKVSDPNSEAVPSIPACGSNLTYGAIISEQNFTGGQECLYTICGEAGDPVTVQMQAQNEALNPWLEIRDPEGKLLFANDDFQEGNSDSLMCNVGLPQTGCFTIVARSLRNASAGPFTLSVDKNVSCQQPVEGCQVVTPIGLNLRNGPGTKFQRVRALPASTQLEVLPDSQDRNWKQVRVMDGSADVGWVNTNQSYLSCTSMLGATPVTATVTPTVTPTPVVLPTSTPKPDSPTGTGDCKKCSPFGAP